ncbi:MAG: hypothetical protein AAGA46_03135 [Cyanobacteria bacterium P01_F01_bin.13]
MTKTQRQNAVILNAINGCTMKQIKQETIQFADALGICLKKMAKALGLDRRCKASWVELATILMTDRRRVKKAWKIA